MGVLLGRDHGHEIWNAPRRAAQGVIKGRKGIRLPAGGEMQRIGEVEPVFVEVDRLGHCPGVLDRDPRQCEELTEPARDHGDTDS